MLTNVETNLEKIKETAIAFLYIQPEFNETFPFLVLHPFIGNNPYPVPTGKGSYDFLDITKEENLNTLIDKLRQVILDTPTVHKLFLLITQSHRRTFSNISTPIYRRKIMEYFYVRFGYILKDNLMT